VPTARPAATGAGRLPAGRESAGRDGDPEDAAGRTADATGRDPADRDAPARAVDLRRAVDMRLLVLPAGPAVTLRGATVGGDDGGDVLSCSVMNTGASGVDSRPSRRSRRP
jgi:hypothetical protein